MLNAGHDVPLRRAVAGERISDHDAWRWHLLFQQLAQHPKPPAISTWTISRSTRKRLCGHWPPDGGRARDGTALHGGSAPPTSNITNPAKLLNLTHTTTVAFVAATRGIETG